MLKYYLPTGPNPDRGRDTRGNLALPNQLRRLRDAVRD